MSIFDYFGGGLQPWSQGGLSGLQQAQFTQQQMYQRAHDMQNAVANEGYLHQLLAQVSATSYYNTSSQHRPTGCAYCGRNRTTEKVSCHGCGAPI